MTRSAKPNSAPPLVDRFVAQIRPPIARIRRAQTNRPIPAPAAVRAVSASGRTARRAAPLSSGGKPGPVVDDPDDHLAVVGLDVDPRPSCRRRRTSPRSRAGSGRPARRRSGRRSRSGRPAGRSSSNVTPGQRPSSERDDRRQQRAGARTGSAPTSPPSSPKRVIATTSSTSRWSRSDSTTMSPKISRRVSSGSSSRPGEDLRAGVDRRHRRPQLVGQDADERVADGLPLARHGDVAEDDDRLVAGPVASGSPASRRPARC